MRLLNDEKAFLEKRGRFVRSWRYVGPSLLFLLAGTGGWLYFRYPLLANPAQVLAQLQRGVINPQTVEFMAVLLPVAIALILFLCGVFVLLATRMDDQWKRRRPHICSAYVGPTPRCRRFRPRRRYGWPPLLLVYYPCKPLW